MPPILREVSCSVSNLTGYLRQEDDAYTGREALIVHLLGGRSNRVTSLAKRTNQGSIQFHSFNLFYLFSSLFSNIEDNVQLKCKGVDKGRLMIPHRIPLCLIFACLIVIV